MYPAKADLRGNIGLGSREHLLQELAALKERRNKLALERPGESLRELEGDTRLLVIGKQGAPSDSVSQLVGGHMSMITGRN